LTQLSQVSQVIGVPVQTPFWQLSPVVQALPSLQSVPLSRLTWPQDPFGLQTVVVQALTSSAQSATVQQLAFGMQAPRQGLVPSRQVQTE